MIEWILKHKKLALAGAALLVLLVAGGIIGYNLLQADKAESLEAISPETVQDDSLDAWGEVKYEKVYDINIDFPSVVTDVKVKEGDRVSMGQELVTLDMSEYLGTMEKLREQLAAGQAGLDTTVQDTGALSEDIAQLQKDIKTKTDELNKGTNSDLRILQTSLDLAKKELETAKKDVRDNQALYDAGTVSKSLLDQYADILDQREKALSDIGININRTKNALKTELDQLKIQLTSKQEQLDQINNSNGANTAKQNSSVAASRIDLDIMKSKSEKDYLNSNSIVSSVKNGIVQNIGVINGTMLGTQNMPTRVLQLIDADSIVVSAEVDEEFIKNVTLGETVEIVPTSDTTLSIPGVVSQISNVAVEKDGKRIVKVEVKPQDTEGQLKPGYTADVYFSFK
ncbi:MAG TPA: efflux RND transporter periplasmic adaptor subunit [Clostridia bacterium]|nr:efflux RND transporter periplasmic adaptor subunit [Clostridia bacterium]